jgi:hypothetical protein
MPKPIIAEILGVDPGIVQRIHEWTEALLKAGVPEEDNPKILHGGGEAVMALGHFLPLCLRTVLP